MKLSRIPHYIITAIRHPKRALRKIDQKFLGGFFVRRKNKQIEMQRIAEEKARSQRLHKYASMIDVESILKKLHPYEYVLTKMDVPYMPDDFPKHFPIGKDMDIICSEKDLTAIVEIVHSNLNKMIDVDKFEYKVIEKSPKHVYLRIEESEKLFYQFDIACELNGVDDMFIDNMLNRRLAKDSYYVPHIEDELLIRVYEVMNNPRKQHHIEFISQHANQVNVELISRYLGATAEKIVHECVAKQMRIGRSRAGGVFAETGNLVN